VLHGSSGSRVDSDGALRGFRRLPPAHRSHASARFSCCRTLREFCEPVAALPRRRGSRDARCELRETARGARPDRFGRASGCRMASAASPGSFALDALVKDLAHASNSGFSPSARAKRASSVRGAIRGGEGLAPPTRRSARTAASISRLRAPPIASVSASASPMRSGETARRVLRQHSGQPSKRVA